MALRSLSLLVWVAVALRDSCLGASSHSLNYFFTSISEPNPGQPHFVIVGYMDSQAFVYYDSHNRRAQPRVSWMEKVKKEEPHYWDTLSQIARGEEEVFREDLEVVRFRDNQSEGLHTWQSIVNCELHIDGSNKGFWQYAYNGKNFLTFNMEALTWVAPEPQAQIIQRKWDAGPELNQDRKAFLEEECIEWLEKYLSYGNETLLRKEPPEVTVSRKTEVEDGMETHVCRLHGFYPREIDASWTRDGEKWLSDTFRGSVAPNADGTFYTWLSIQINPQERSRYRCHVEHDSLEEALDVALEESKSNVGLIIGIVAGLLILLGVIVVGIWYCKRRHDYKKAATSDRGSSPGSNLIVYQPSCSMMETPSLKREERIENQTSELDRRVPSGPSSILEPGYT